MMRLARSRQIVGGAEVEAQLLDLADLASVRRFADAFVKRHTALDILIMTSKSHLAPPPDENCSNPQDSFSPVLLLTRVWFVPLKTRGLENA
jgi:NAD(P)-dependent dehydrogenase (short-subunit alcohol dehydrogenase family)